MTRKGIANFIKTNTMTDNELYIHGNNGEGMFIAKFSPYLQAVMKRDNRHF